MTPMTWAYGADSTVALRRTLRNLPSVISNLPNEQSRCAASAAQPARKRAPWWACRAPATVNCVSYSIGTTFGPSRHKDGTDDPYHRIEP